MNIEFPNSCVKSFQLGTINTVQSFIGDGSYIESTVQHMNARRWKLKIITPKMDTQKQRLYSAFQMLSRGSNPFKFVLPKVEKPVGAVASSATIDTVTFNTLGNLKLHSYFTMGGRLLRIIELNGNTATIWPFVQDTTRLDIASDVYGVFIAIVDDRSRPVLTAFRKNHLTESLTINAEEYLA